MSASRNMTDPLIERMQTQVQQWQEVDDTRSTFLYCYQLMTSNMLSAIEAGEFSDQAWIDELLRRFAGYYFNALDAYEQKSRAVPAVWSITHDATHNPKTRTLQNLLLGVNAHINYDLIFTLAELLQPEWDLLDEQQRQCRYMDHCRVNEIIGQTIDSVQDQVVEPLEPGLELVDILLLNADEWMISRLISHWREEVWQKAIQLLECIEPGDRQHLQQEIEFSTLQRANAILLKQGLGGLRELL